jgi:hypothetical protein
MDEAGEGRGVSCSELRKRFGDKAYGVLDAHDQVPARWAEAMTLAEG